ncbi:chemotaxis protein CheC [Acetivibrio clariflavus]|uniref:Chemotaxis protein CheC, inhibitor of MCP methylation n=1 Tax=Acetivibrio clariflavus (strain DSM 19732 / NBRC 101661 / EBR45) TaxID=720554 RepID=G8LVF2_ACECE|nr:chemotaxis protein CheC [Acetivibrio clariflavus]AEV68541.1 chemotaxis protein CheC, inhibitor of MCP methylation [Acetivibrio clariflavus DSM 19732]
MSMSFGSLNNFEIDVLKEIGNIGAGNAATALAKMINKKVDMEVPKVKVMEFREVTEMFGGAELPVVGILLKMTGDVTGSIMLILENNAARILVNMLMGKSNEKSEYNPEENDEIICMFDEIEMSALKELGNILAGSYISSLSTLTGLNILPTVPDIAIDMAGAIISVPAIEFGKIGDSVLYIETVFIEGETRALGDFFLVPDMDSYEVLLRALGVIS